MHSLHFYRYMKLQTYKDYTQHTRTMVQHYFEAYLKFYEYDFYSVSHSDHNYEDFLSQTLTYLQLEQLLQDEWLAIHKPIRCKLAVT